MKYSEMLKKKMQALFAANQAMLDAAAAHKEGEIVGHELTAEEQTLFDKNLAEANGLKVKITQAEIQESASAAINAPRARVTEGVAISSGLQERAQVDPTRSYGENGLGAFAIDVHNFNTGRGMSNGLKILAAALDGQTAGIKSDGGVLMPPAFSTTIMDFGPTSDSLMAETDQLPPLPNNCESMTYPVVNESSRADSSRNGGILFRWKAELTQMSESKLTFRDTTLSPNEGYIFIPVSDKLLKFAPQLSSFLSSKARDEINFAFGNSIINGNGAGQFRGILSGAVDAPRVLIAKESGQAAASIVVTNLEKMYARMPARYMPGAKWYINQDVYPALFSMVKAVGTGGVPVFMPGNNVSGAPFGTIYGLPIRPIEYCATLGTEGDIILANLKQYVTQGTGEVDTGMSIHLKFDYNQTVFRFIVQADGKPWQPFSITPYKGTAKQSPVVTLATRA